MTNKAYIVENEQQECELLKRLEKERCSWNDTENTPPTEWYLGRYPYAIVVKADKKLLWTFNIDVTETEIVYDGRKEEQMSDKYVVSQEFMNELKEWKEILRLDNILFIGRKALSNLPNLLDKWWRDGSVSVHESNNRLIAIIRWVNGEDVFEVEKPKKWVVRSKGRDDDGNYGYVDLIDNAYAAITNIRLSATRFDTKEEAESWANAHQEVVQVEVDE